VVGEATVAVLGTPVSILGIMIPVSELPLVMVVSGVDGGGCGGSVVVCPSFVLETDGTSVSGLMLLVVVLDAGCGGCGGGSVLGGLLSVVVIDGVPGTGSWPRTLGAGDSRSLGVCGVLDLSDGLDVVVTGGVPGTGSWPRTLGTAVSDRRDVVLTGGVPATGSLPRTLESGANFKELTSSVVVVDEVPSAGSWPRTLGAGDSGALGVCGVLGIGTPVTGSLPRRVGSGVFVTTVVGSGVGKSTEVVLSPICRRILCQGIPSTVTSNP